MAKKEGKTLHCKSLPSLLRSCLNLEYKKVLFFIKRELFAVRLFLAVVITR